MSTARIDQVLQLHAGLEDDDVVKPGDAEVHDAADLDLDLARQDYVADRIALLDRVKTPSKRGVYI